MKLKYKKLFTLFFTICLLFCIFTTITTTVSAATTSNGNGGKTDIGAWFVTYNTEKMWSNNFGSGYPINYRMLLPDGTYGIPESDNVEIIDYQLQQLADAKIDFILFDLTNGGLTSKIGYGWEDNYWITENAQLTCSRIVKWNKTHEWKIKYAVAVGVYAALRKDLSIGEAAEYQSEGVWELFYSKYGEDNYYQLNGKPLMVLHDFGTVNAVNAPGGWKLYSVSSKTDHDSGDRFTMKGSLSTPNQDTGLAWYTPREGNIVTNESATVCPGQWSNHSADPNSPRKNGQHYIDDWKTIIKSDIVPKMVLISSFNDFNEDTAVFISDSSKCNPSWEEQWIDDTGEINNSMYWEITKEGIYKLRKKNGDTFKDLNKLKEGIDTSWFSERNVKVVENNTFKATIKATFYDAKNVMYYGIGLGVFVLLLLSTGITIIAVNLKHK